MPGRARSKGKVERHEKFGVFVFLAPGRTGLIPMSETGADQRRGCRARRFRSARDVEVIVLEVDADRAAASASASRPCTTRRRRTEVREYTEREDAAPSQGFGSLADKLRGALKPREK